MLSAPMLPFQTYRPEVWYVEVIYNPGPPALDLEARKKLGLDIDYSSDHPIEIVELEMFLALEPFELVAK